MPFMLRVRMGDGSERLAYLSDTSREGARNHADKLLTQEGIEGVQIEEFHEEFDDELEPSASAEAAPSRDRS